MNERFKVGWYVLRKTLVQRKGADGHNEQQPMAWFERAIYGPSTTEDDAQREIAKLTAEQPGIGRDLVTFYFDGTNHLARSSSDSP